MLSIVSRVYRRAPLHCPESTRNFAQSPDKRNNKKEKKTPHRNKTQLAVLRQSPPITPPFHKVFYSRTTLSTPRLTAPAQPATPRSLIINATTASLASFFPNDLSCSSLLTISTTSRFCCGVIAGKLFRTFSCSIFRSRSGRVVGVPANSVSSSEGNSSSTSSISEHDEGADDNGVGVRDLMGVEVRDLIGGETMDAGRSFQCSLMVPD